MLYLEYIVMLMADRCFGLSDNSLSVLELPLCKMFRTIANIDKQLMQTNKCDD